MTEFNTSIAEHKNTHTKKTLAQAFAAAHNFAGSLSLAKQGFARTLPQTSQQAQTQLAQSESMEGIIGILKKAYKLIGDIK